MVTFEKLNEFKKISISEAERLERGSPNDTRDPLTPQYAPSWAVLRDVQNEFDRNLFVAESDYQFQELLNTYYYTGLAYIYCLYSRIKKYRSYEFDDKYHIVLKEGQERPDGGSLEFLYNVNKISIIRAVAYIQKKALVRGKMLIPLEEFSIGDYDDAGEMYLPHYQQKVQELLTEGSKVADRLQEPDGSVEKSVMLLEGEIRKEVPISQLPTLESLFIKPTQRNSYLHLLNKLPNVRQHLIDERSNAWRGGDRKKAFVIMWFEELEKCGGILKTETIENLDDAQKTEILNSGIKGLNFSTQGNPFGRYTNRADAARGEMQMLIKNVLKNTQG